MDIELPTRIVIVGASSTGKSELVKKMILKRVFGEKPQILIYAPNEITLKQHCWASLPNVTFTLLNKKTPQPSLQNNGKNRVIIFDDLDQIFGVPFWVQEMFTIASHHLNTSVVCISHKLKIGSVCMRGSALWIILTASQNKMLKETCDYLKLDYDKVFSLLCHPSGVIESSPGQYKSYNHIFINNSFSLDNNEKFYKLTKISEPKALEEFLT